MEYLLLCKGNELLIHTDGIDELPNVMLTARRQIKKDCIVYDLFPIQLANAKSSILRESRPEAVWGWEYGEGRGRGTRENFHR